MAVKTLLFAEPDVTKLIQIFGIGVQMKKIFLFVKIV